MQVFKDCITGVGLDHVRTVGDHFTWSNNKPSSLVHKKLDRLLANASWFTTFLEAQVLVLPRGVMDHCPLILTVPMELERYFKPFQFFNFMIDLNGFLETVSKS